MTSLESMYSLIIAEKPSAAKKIAESLADGKAIQEKVGQVSYYKVTHGKDDLIVVSAVGHLYGLAQSEGKKSQFPVFDVVWKESSDVNKKNDYSKKYITVIKKLAKDASTIIVACDYDQEGSVIGMNVLRYACKAKDGHRMKFSTLTKEDLIEAYETRSKHLDWQQAEAGETRHFLDWYNGINYSRALTSAIKSQGAYKLMSTGRVQGPALKIIVEKEKEIKAFIPVPYWQLSLDGTIKKDSIEAWHIEDKFWDKVKADTIYKNIKSEKNGVVKSVEKKQFKQSPPVPFDLTTLQIEAYRTIKVQPKKTLEIAQELYTAGYISYPRTSSQQYPPQINVKKIMQLISKNPSYGDLAKKLLLGPMKPNNGEKTDPAHPAIYPTGIVPSGLEAQESRLYDLIVRRFLAVFADEAVRETMQIIIDLKNEEFETKGTRTVEKGWHVYYGPFVLLEEQTLPAVSKGELVNINSIKIYAKETLPPKRYTPASIIKDLEKKNLGTKATRANIVDTLFQRGYVHGTSIEATDLGIRTIEALSKHCPKIIDEDLTRHFEEEMDLIIEGKKKGKEVLDAAKKDLIDILSDFKKQEKEIGKDLLAAHRDTQQEMSTLGNCPKCKEGLLQIRHGKFGKFAACNKYPECQTTFSLPSNAMAIPAKKQCEQCQYPMVKLIRAKTRPIDVCLNPNCPTKAAQNVIPEEIKKKVDTQCPNCKTGTLLLRNSIYGKFLGCSGYPKCKHTEKIMPLPSS